MKMRNNMRGILVGTGSWGRWWYEKFLPPNIADGTLEIVAVVDSNLHALEDAKKHLALEDRHCFTNVEIAFSRIPADFCIIVTPPTHHEVVVDAAIAHGLHILSEKPLADTLEGAVRVVEKVRRAGLLMGVTMSHRFDEDKTNLREILRQGEYGELDYLACRYTCDLRRYGSWGVFRHEIPYSVLIEGSIHHLDILADMARAPCETLYAKTWRPSWAEYKGDCQALVIMEFENGKHAVYEAANANALSLNPWGNEYIRAECEKGILILDRREITAYPYTPGVSWTDAASVSPRKIPLRRQPKWANTWLAETFVRWLEGGASMETEAEANLQSMALTTAAIESSRCGGPVRVQDLLAQVRQDISSRMR
jgi:predicted dehydrogenase